MPISNETKALVNAKIDMLTNEKAALLFAIDESKNKLDSCYIFRIKNSIYFTRELPLGVF